MSVCLEEGTWMMVACGPHTSESHDKITRHAGRRDAGVARGRHDCRVRTLSTIDAISMMTGIMAGFVLSVVEGRGENLPRRCGKEISRTWKLQLLRENDI